MARLKPPQRRRPFAGDPGKSCPFAHRIQGRVSRQPKRPPGREAVLLAEQVALVHGGLGAELFEGANQLAGDLLGGGLLDDVALHQIDQLAVTHNGDGG